MPIDDSTVSRRHLLGFSLLGTAAAIGNRLLPDAVDSQQPQSEQSRMDFDLTKGSAALQPDKIVASACQFCNSNCRLHVHLKAGRVIDITGEPADPVQAGELCVKGPMMAELVNNPHRLLRPMKRVAGEKGDPQSEFSPITWNEALETIARKFLALRDAGEAHCIANKTSGRLPRGTGSLVGRLFTMLGSPNDTDVGPVCNDAGGDALAWTFGLGNFTNGYGVDPATGKEDLGSARFLLFFGTNQAETHPVTFKYLLRSRSKTKARLVVIDPRLTATGAQADLWLAPKPHTDLALVLAMLRHIVTAKLYDRAFVRSWVAGFDELRDHLAATGYTLEWAEKTTGIPAAKVQQLAEEYAKSKPAAIFCNAGISHQLGAFDTYRAMAFLAAITGNIGVPGGGCNFMHNTWPGGLNLPPLPAALPAKSHPALPVGPDAFAEAILSEKPYPLKALVTCGNPLLASSNTVKVARAYKKLDFYVYTGLFMEESAYYADIILPVCSGLEMETVYMRRDDRAIRWQKQAVARMGESRSDWEIWIDLAHTLARLDRQNSPTYWTEAFPTSWKDYVVLWETFRKHTPGMGGMTQARMESSAQPVRWPCPDEKHPGVSTLYLDHPTWYEAAVALDPANKGKRFLTPSGKVEIFTAPLDAHLKSAGHSALPVFYTHPEVAGSMPRLKLKREELIPNPVNDGSLTPMIAISGALESVAPEYPLNGIIGRPSVVHFSSVTQWTTLGKQMNGIRLVQIHPKVAERAGLADGDNVVVESPRGAVSGTVLVWNGIREDTIFVPNTFGPMQQVATEMGVPLYTAANTLVDDQYFDNLSGQQAYKCFACRVRKG